MKDMIKLKEIHATTYFTFKQMLRSETNALYAQIDNETGLVVCYEVFKIKKRLKSFYSSGLNKVFPAKEIYPKNEDFGYSAWAISSYNTAMIAYNNLELFGTRGGNSKGDVKVLNMNEDRSMGIALSN